MGERIYKERAARNLSQSDLAEALEVSRQSVSFNANVDFELIAPDGLFYSVNVTNGSVNKAIEVSQRGNYKFAIRNNLSFSISVSGYVNY